MPGSCALTGIQEEMPFSGKKKSKIVYLTHKASLDFVFVGQAYTETQTDFLPGSMGPLQD